MRRGADRMAMVRRGQAGVGRWGEVVIGEAGTDRKVMVGIG